MFGSPKFTVTEAHIKLLRKANVSWMYMETGAPCIDFKRPYGNSDVYPDIAEVLNISVDEDGEYTDQQKILMDNVHEETQIALEIFLRTGTMISGTYTKNGYSYPWIKVSE